jgi:hypothetical protein
MGTHGGRGPFGTCCTALATNDADAQRWRTDYFTGLVREDFLDFSRLQEVNAMRLFAEQWANAQAIQLVRECKAESDSGRIQIRDTAHWLAALEV